MLDFRHKLFSKRSNHWQTCMGVILMLFVFSTSVALGAEVLFVVGKKNLAGGKKALRSGDVAIKNHLADRGFEVVTCEDTIVKSEDAAGKDLVILSESARSNRVSTKFRDITIPVEGALGKGRGGSANAHVSGDRDLVGRSKSDRVIRSGVNRIVGYHDGCGRPIGNPQGDAAIRHEGVVSDR